jgi:hypothetical protein
MINAHRQFLVNIEETRKIQLIATNFSGQVSTIIDLSSILRSCIVLSVSALDHFIHEMTLIGMLDIFNGVRPNTQKYLKHSVSLQFVSSLASSSPSTIFENEIRKNLGWQTFQRPDKIKEAIGLFSSIPLWPQVSLAFNATEKNIKDQLELIIDRRNMIAHEADIEPIYKTRRPILPTDVTLTIDFIEKLGNVIFNIVK